MLLSYPWGVFEGLSLSKYARNSVRVCKESCQSMQGILSKYAGNPVRVCKESCQSKCRLKVRFRDRYGPSIHVGLLRPILAVLRPTKAAACYPNLRVLTRGWREDAISSLTCSFSNRQRHDRTISPLVVRFDQSRCRHHEEALLPVMLAKGSEGIQGRNMGLAPAA